VIHPRASLVEPADNAFEGVSMRENKDGRGRWIARKAARPQMVADSHRVHARRAGLHGLELAHEAGAWDRVAACLLTGGVIHDFFDGTAASARCENVATITIRVGETPWSSLFTISS
jgi:hypothetical protein